MVGVPLGMGFHTWLQDGMAHGKEMQDPLRSLRIVLGERIEPARLGGMAPILEPNSCERRFTSYFTSPNRYAGFHSMIN